MANWFAVILLTELSASYQATSYYFNELCWSINSRFPFHLSIFYVTNTEVKCSNCRSSYRTVNLLLWTLYVVTGIG